ncbi:hypothetical protein Hypma_002856 [Hypsizygus marmoreus]|uniref:Uncharacterized protein n=1 Tax=Hypsizygus marmoreus TaxID=39966 RepID=A0A369J385_HYPMA|nr:hypothetical protein Hypma_002856 [Hypsizygus marmoreus]
MDAFAMQALESPISCLPPELILQIFLHAIPGDSPRGRSLVKIVSALCRICRHWRRTILAYPFLWRDMIDFDVNNENWIHTLLQRCRSLPVYAKISTPLLHDYATDSDDPPPLGWKVLLKNLHRVENLALCLSRLNDSCSTFAFDQLLVQPAPILRRLHIEILGVTDWNYESGVIFAPNLPGSLFAGSCSLRHLSLHNCRFEPGLARTSFGQLVSLSVIYTKRVSRHTPQKLPSVWLEILSVMPLLEDLEISDWIVGSDFNNAVHSTAQHNLANVRLDNLSSLCLTRAIWDCVDILHHLRFPLSCTLKIECMSTRPGRDYVAIYSFIQSRIAEMSRTTLMNNISFSVGDSYGFRFGGYLEKEPLEKVCVSFLLAGAHPQDFHPSFSSWFSDYKHAKEVTMTLYSDRETDCVAFADIARPFALVTTLHAGRAFHWPSAALRALMPEGRGGSSLLF